MDITVTFESSEVVPIQTAQLNASGTVAVLSHIRYCHILVDLPLEQALCWERALVALGEDAIRPCRDMAWLETNARVSDVLLILCRDVPFDLVENQLAAIDFFANQARVRGAFGRHGGSRERAFELL